MTATQRKIHDSSLEIISKKGTIKDAMFQHSILCQTFLPYRNPGKEVTSWERKQGNAVLLLESTKILDEKTGHFVSPGLPYGPRARIIMAYADTQAVKSQSPVIGLESCLHAFLKKLGWGTDGRTRNGVEDQIKRILGTHIKIGFVDSGENATRVRGANIQLVSDYDLWYSGNQEGQDALFPSYIKYSDRYFEHLMEHAVPLDERALSVLSHNAMALDIYAWLAQRLHRIDPNRPQFIAWTNMKDQFGQGYKTMKKFKEVFRKTLQIVRLQYMQARIKEENNKGFWLYHSASPIEHKTMIFLGDSNKK